MTNLKEKGISHKQAAALSKSSLACLGAESRVDDKA